MATGVLTGLATAGAVEAADAGLENLTRANIPDSDVAPVKTALTGALAGGFGERGWPGCVTHVGRVQGAAT